MPAAVPPSSKSLTVAAHSSSVHALRISSPTSRVSPFDRFLILAEVVRFPPGCPVSPTSPSVRPPHGSIGARCRGHNPRKAYRLSDRLRIDAEGPPGPLAGMEPVNSQRDPITTRLCPVASGCAGLRTRDSLVWQGTAAMASAGPAGIAVRTSTERSVTSLCPGVSGCAGLRTRDSVTWQGTAAFGKRRPRRELPCACLRSGNRPVRTPGQSHGSWQRRTRCVTVIAWQCRPRRKPRAVSSKGGKE